MEHLKGLKDFNLLFITGPSSTGKSTIVREWSKSLKSSFSNLITKYSQELLFQDILQQLSTGCSVRDRQEFIVELQKISTKVVIILDSVEKLEIGLFNFFTRIPEIVNASIVMISKVSWNTFGNSIVNPLILEFPAYSRQEILDILVLDTPDGVQEEFYRDFAKIVYETVYKSSRNLVEIRTLCLKLFPKFIEPVLQGKVKKEEVSKLVLNVSKYLKEIGSSVVLGSFSSFLELPYYTKFLLISSFLASFNPARLDTRFFSKEREARISRRGKKSVKLRQQLLGPRIFPQSRMLAIFYSIVDEPLQDSVIINQQMTTLVNLKLVTRVSAQDKLDGLKFKCNAPFEVVNSVASSVRMDLVKYLNEWI